MIQPDIPSLNIVEKEKGTSNPGSKERKEERTEIISRNTSTESNHHENFVIIQHLLKLY